jgi:hypothetical protein
MDDKVTRRTLTPFQTIACSRLSATTLAGLAMNAAFGWAWADSLAALVLMPIIAREGLEAIGLCGGDEDED